LGLIFSLNFSGIVIIIIMHTISRPQQKVRVCVRSKQRRGAWTETESALSHLETCAMLKCKSLYVNGNRFITATKIIVCLKVWRESSKCEIYFITHCVPFATTNGNRNSVYQSLFFSPLRKKRGNKPYLLAGLCNSCSFYNAMVQQKAQQRHRDNQD
jgi:hypothetical protein